MEQATKKNVGERRQGVLDEACHKCLRNLKVMCKRYSCTKEVAEIEH